MTILDHGFTSKKKFIKTIVNLEVFNERIAENKNDYYIQKIFKDIVIDHINRKIKDNKLHKKYITNILNGSRRFIINETIVHENKIYVCTYKIITPKLTDKQINKQKIKDKKNVKEVKKLKQNCEKQERKLKCKINNLKNKGLAKKLENEVTNMSESREEIDTENLEENLEHDEIKNVRLKILNIEDNISRNKPSKLKNLKNKLKKLEKTKEDQEEKVRIEQENIWHSPSSALGTVACEQISKYEDKISENDKKLKKKEEAMQKFTYKYKTQLLITSSNKLLYAP